MKIGVILFDDPKIGEQGWGAKSGQEAERINGINALDQEYIWITNVDYMDFNNLGFRNVSYLRETHYMRGTIKTFIEELGLKSSPSKAAEILSNIFQRVIKFGNEMFGIDPKEHSHRYANLLAQKIIPMNMRKAPTHNNESISDALEEATQLMQNNVGRRPNGRKAITVHMPRIAYFNWLLNSRVPVDREWKKIAFNTGEFEVGIEKGKEIEGTKTRMSKLDKLSEDNAFMFNISIKSMEDEYLSFASFGVGKKTSRTWVTYPELKELARYSRIEVKKGLKTQIGALDEDVQDKDPSTNFSYSKGIFLENLISALSTNVDGVLNGVIPYIRAYDRMACLKAAEVLNSEGYYVMSYSFGKIVVLVPETGIEEFVSKSLSMGLQPPVSLLSQLDSGEIFVEDEIIDQWMPNGLIDEIKKDWYIEFVRTLAPTGLINKDLIVEIDNILEEPKKDREDKLNSVINKMIEKSENISDNVSDSTSGNNKNNNSDDTEILEI
mgnify:CR=1 FL=1